MKTKDLVLNFVRQFKKPFTAETVSNMIAQDLSVIEPVLLELLADKKIKLISKKEGIYVLADRYSPKVCYSQKGIGNSRLRQLPPCSTRSRRVNTPPSEP